MEKILIKLPDGSEKEMPVNSTAKDVAASIAKSLEKKGLIIGDLKPSIYGPRRKYYSLTEKGIKEKQEFFKEWNQLNSCLTNLIKGVDEYEN